MIVCAHGDVSEFCEKHDMRIFDRYIGYLYEYRGSCPVLVTDHPMTREEYDSMKCELFSHGIELVSTKWTDDEVILRLLRSQVDRRRKRGGRQMFGYRKVNGVIEEIPELIAVARLVIKLRDAGKTLLEIRAHPDVRWRDGRMLAQSTIETIVRNRGKYENG